MTKICKICNKQIFFRDSRASICFPCYDSGYGVGQRRAHAAVCVAIKKGKLKPAHDSYCVDCGNPATEYDHRDYNKPLEVEPVCQSCNYKRGSAIPLDMTNVVVRKRVKRPEPPKFLFTSCLLYTSPSPRD